MNAPSPTGRKRIDPFEWLLAALPRRGVQYLLALGAAFSLFASLEEIIDFAKWIASWVDYWGTFWAWAFNGLLQWIDIRVTRADANFVSGIAILFMALLRGELASTGGRTVRSIGKLQVFAAFAVWVAFGVYFGVVAHSVSRHGAYLAGFTALLFVALLAVVSIYRRWGEYKKSKGRFWAYSYGTLMDPNALHHYTIVFVRVAVVFLVMLAINLAVAVYENAPPFPDT